MVTQRTEGPRSAQSRSAILAAFTDLLAVRRYDTIRIADLIARAGLGRSTFYDHFAGKDAVLSTAMEPVIVALVAAAAGRADGAYITQIVEHLWARRSIGRLILSATVVPIVQRQLTEAIAARLATTRPDIAAPAITAAGIAAAQLTMLHRWLSGAAACPADVMADRLKACARLADPTL